MNEEKNKPEPKQMKPMIVLPVGEVTPEDIQQLRDNGICVIEAKEPANVRFVEPLESSLGQDDFARAAIQLTRRILCGEVGGFAKGDCSKLLAEILIKGSPIDPAETPQEYAANLFDEFKDCEIAELAKKAAEIEMAPKLEEAKLKADELREENRLAREERARIKATQKAEKAAKQ